MRPTQENKKQNQIAEAKNGRGKFRQDKTLVYAQGSLRRRQPREARRTDDGVHAIPPKKGHGGLIIRHNFGDPDVSHDLSQRTSMGSGQNQAKNNTIVMEWEWNQRRPERTASVARDRQTGQ